MLHSGPIHAATHRLGRCHGCSATVDSIESGHHGAPTCARPAGESRFLFFFSFLFVCSTEQLGVQLAQRRGKSTPSIIHQSYVCVCVQA